MEIVIEGLRAFGHHGAVEQEQDKGQTFIIDLRLDLGNRRQAIDELSSTIDYTAVCDTIVKTVSVTKFKLIETLAEEICKELFHQYQTKKVWIKVRKPSAPLQTLVDYVGVCLERTLNDNRIS